MSTQKRIPMEKLDRTACEKTLRELAARGLSKKEMVKFCTGSEESEVRKKLLRMDLDIDSQAFNSGTAAEAAWKYGLEVDDE